MSTPSFSRLASVLLSLAGAAVAASSLVVACSSANDLDDVGDAGPDSPAADTAAADGSKDGGAAGDGATEAAIVCDYPPFANDPLCPAQYSYQSKDKACPSVGLRCQYPGAGDVRSDGCNSTALMMCVHPGGFGADAGDAGDGGAGTWVIAQ